jgi:penicillin-binding protein 2
VEAIQESCNYFFFDVGRQLTIEKMNEYCRHWGLGQPTGIELPEFTGILAGPDYRNENGLDTWGPGDTLQAAIGQSDWHSLQGFRTEERPTTPGVYVHQGHKVAVSPR